MTHRSIPWSLAAVLVLAGAVAQADVRVGAPFALTGPVAEQAQGMRRGAELAELQVNQQGGVLGQPYRLVFADTACDAGRGVQAVRQLIESGVVALVGPVCSGVTLRQAQSVSVPAGVVTLSVASASSLITQLDDQDLVFRTAPSDAAKGQALARQAMTMGLRVIAVSHAADAYNTGVARVFAEAFTRLGGRVVMHQTHPSEQRDFRREARALSEAAPNIALFAYAGASGLPVLQALMVQPQVQQVLGTDGLKAPELVSGLTPEQLAKLTFVVTAPDLQREAWRRWLVMASKAGLQPEGTYVANAYDAAFLLALAIEAAGSADRTRLAAALRAVSGPEGTPVFPGEFAKARALLRQGERINYEGASGPVDFDAAGDVQGSVSVWRAGDGGAAGANPVRKSR